MQYRRIWKFQSLISCDVFSPAWYLKQNCSTKTNEGTQFLTDLNFKAKSQPDSAYSNKNENFQIVLSNGVEHLKPWMARPLETKQLG